MAKVAGHVVKREEQGYRSGEILKTELRQPLRGAKGLTEHDDERAHGKAGFR